MPNETKREVWEGAGIQMDIRMSLIVEKLWGWATSAVFSVSLDLFSVVVIFILVSYFEGLESQKMQGLLFQRGFEERMKRM